MDIMTEFLASTLYNTVLLWTSKLPLPLLSMKIIPKQLQHQHPASCNNYKFALQAGLKTLVTHPEQEKQKLPPNVVHCYTVAPTTPTPPPPPPPPPPSMWLECNMIGDVLGAESGDYMTSEELAATKAKNQEEPATRGKRRTKKKREYPPPITLLRTQKGRMAWVFEGECDGEGEGRLVLRAERVWQKEYVEAEREGGRLTMRVVRGHHDEEYCEECGYPMNVEEDLEFNEQEWQQHKCWDLRVCGSGLLQGSDHSLWTGANSKGYVARPASASASTSTSAPLRPITYVM